ncbi:ankyrin [Nemania sp. FL0031]|nr:ankyrin [Nemania sp. FL0031]
MDPLSATASIIALVQAAVAVSKGVRFLRSFGQIPSEFTDLLNELSTLHAVIEQVEVALREWETLRPTTSYSASLQSVDSSKVLSLKDNLAQVVEELDALCHRLEAPRKRGKKQGHDERPAVSKLRWQKERSNIARLRYKAQSSRELLSLCFSAFSSSQAQQHVKVTLDMQQMLFTATGNILQLQIQNAEAEEGSRAILKQLQESVDLLKQNLADRKLENGIRTSKSLLDPRSMIQFQATLVRECPSTCNCNCHHFKHSRSPTWLATLIGNLFLQYNTIPVFKRPTCDKLVCTAKSLPSVRLYYAFPQWLVARSIELNVSWSSLFGPGSSLHIRVPRVLLSHPIWRAIQFGDIHWVRNGLANKSVLPTDVDRWGRSLATIALHNHQYELAKLFAQQGCDIHSKDIFGQTAASTAKLMQSISYYSPDIIQKMDAHKNLLAEFSLRQHMRETVQSSKIHQAIIQDEDESFSAFINVDSIEVNQLDGFGFAPLHWATYRRKSKIVRALLEAGAAPNIRSTKGDAPLSIAAKSHDVDSVRLLLEFGADVNLPNPFTGYTAIFAAYRHTEISRLLLDYGAHLGRETINGLQTPLYYAAQESYDRKPNSEDRSLWAEWFQCLLSAGLDIDNQSGTHAMAPIMLSLWNRNTILLELLIDAGARLDLIDSKQRGILHYAVLSTTTESIEILRRAKISSINPDLPDAEGETPLMWLASRMYASDENLAAGERRVTTDEFWAFKSLVDEIRERNKEKRQFNLMAEERNESASEIDVGIEIDSDGDDSVVGWWGGSRVIRARSTSSGCDEFLDFED